MRAVVQRVSEASVTVDGAITGQIGRGFLVLLGIAGDDTEQDVVWIAEKIAGLRVFEDSEGRMNLGLAEVAGAVLLVSQTMRPRADALQGVLQEAGVRVSRVALADEHDYPALESALLDLAAERGGNVAVTRPGEVYTTENGVTLIGHMNVAGRLPTSASRPCAVRLCRPWLLSIAAVRSGRQCSETRCRRRPENPRALPSKFLQASPDNRW